MSRLRERQEIEEPKRVEYAMYKLKELGFNPTFRQDLREVSFLYKGCTIRLYPYTGWFSGIGVKNGRGIKNLLKQL